MAAKLVNVQLTDHKDTFVWSVQRTSQFRVRSMYKSLVVPVNRSYNNIIWKLKLHLRIKIFFWYLIKGVVLTKDNLTKWQWRASLMCCYCNFLDESIHLLFFDCHIARFILRLVQVSFNITPPQGIHHMFNGWLQGINTKLKHNILVRASALCWKIWLSRNNMISNNTWVVTSMHVIYRGTHWIFSWTLLLKQEENPKLFWGVVVDR